LSDEDFVKTLLSSETPEAAQKLLSDKGVSLSIEEIRSAGETLSKLAEGEISSELSEDELEQVAGGDVICGIIVGIIGLYGATIATEGIMQACGTTLRDAIRKW
ncbi:MAG: hypothetical protein IKN55_09240, partial [Oscillospiraceae bacterium]|nr:hypothetical protein [Oscillospiraceae bacterium]